MQLLSKFQLSSVTKILTILDLKKRKTQIEFREKYEEKSEASVEKVENFLH